MRFTARELIAILLAITMMVGLLLPVIGAVISNFIHGEPTTRPEFLKTVQDIMIYILGILSGFVLQNKQKEKPESPES